MFWVEHSPATYANRGIRLDPWRERRRSPLHLLLTHPRRRLYHNCRSFGVPSPLNKRHMPVDLLGVSEMAVCCLSAAVIFDFDGRQVADHRYGNSLIRLNLG